MSPQFEAGTLEVFADLVAAGLVYRDLKPVHWSIENRTALADAELEYIDREDVSVYVLFEIENPQDLPTSLNARPGHPISLMIWTTTPWTLPANLAVAASPHAQYALYRYELGGRIGVVLLAEALAEKIFGMVEGATFDRLGAATGQQLQAAGVRYRHPFIDRVSPLLTAEYVTLEDGSGLVHTAPGHGVEDYQTGLRNSLPIYCPVREDGTFDDTVPDWLRGMRVIHSKADQSANHAVVEHLRTSGHLFHDHKFMHSYPHDWRSKTPVIFRATEQWFIAVDKPVDAAEYQSPLGATLRERATNVTRSQVKFIPEWGRNRMRGMLESRPDWCVSRQRSWGLPIPAFFGPDKGQVLLTPASVKAVAALFREHGSDAWFTMTAEQLLVHYNAAQDPAAPDWIKTLGTASLKQGRDTFDVWFESGSSWNAVLRQRGLKYPADLYLEGSDQHRGWFQHSMLPALGVTGKNPFDTVLTHGFMVDKNGRKMSKSEGNAIEVESLLKDLGADICRWWVASLNTDNDIKADLSFFKLAGEEYRKVRNTIRFLLSNLFDFDASSHRVEVNAASAHTIDAWAQGQLAALIDTVRTGYETFQFRQVQQAIFNFCNDQMSAVYLAATKDRLYCDGPNWDRRRRTQTVMFDIAHSLIRLVAPILVHTADEAFLALLGVGDDNDLCVHLQHLPAKVASEASPDWPAAMALRDRCLKRLEEFRSGGLENPADAGICVGLPDDLFAKLKPFEPELADLCGVSRFAIEPGPGETIRIDNLTNEPRCERSWKRDGTVTMRSDSGLLTDRDARALGLV
jgi:isoleucyl-tRNA synthetase